MSVEGTLLSMDDTRGVQPGPFQIGREFYGLAGQLGWKDWLKRLDIYRYTEYAGVVHRLQAGRGALVLDAGSANSVFPVYLAVKGYRVLSIDIEHRRVAEQAQRQSRLEGKYFASGALRFERQDVRALTLADASFDAVTAISMIEHIPDAGDIEAVREMARVTKPGGQLIITVPYGPAYYPGRPPQSTRETQRIYDDATLTQRLIAPSGMREQARWYIVNRGFDFERKIWRRIPAKVHQATGWTAAGLLCAQVFFRNAARRDGHSAHAAGLSLIKQ